MVLIRRVRIESAGVSTVYPGPSCIPLVRGPAMCIGVVIMVLIHRVHRRGDYTAIHCISRHRSSNFSHMYMSSNNGTKTPCAQVR